MFFINDSLRESHKDSKSDKGQYKTYKRQLIALKDKKRGGRWIKLFLNAPECSLEDVDNRIEEMTLAWDRLYERKSVVRYFAGYIMIPDVQLVNEYTNTYKITIRVLLFAKRKYYKGGLIGLDQWSIMWSDELGEDKVDDFKVLAFSIPKDPLELDSVLLVLKYFRRRKFSEENYLNKTGKKYYIKRSGLLAVFFKELYKF